MISSSGPGSRPGPRAVISGNVHRERCYRNQNGANQGPTAVLATAAHHVIMQSEATAAHRDLLARHREAYQPVLFAYLEVGAAIPAVAYLHARRLQRRERS